MTTPRVPAISLGDLTKSFGDVHAVRGIDMLLGLSRPTDGSVEVLGLPPRQAIARGLVSAVMQTGGLLKDLTVRETLEYTASLFADTKGVDEVLDSAGITGIADRK